MSEIDTSLCTGKISFDELSPEVLELLYEVDKETIYVEDKYYIQDTDGNFIDLDLGNEFTLIDLLTAINTKVEDIDGLKTKVAKLLEDNEEILDKITDNTEFINTKYSAISEELKKLSDNINNEISVKLETKADKSKVEELSEKVKRHDGTITTHSEDIGKLKLAIGDINPDIDSILSSIVFDKGSNTTLDKIIPSLKELIQNNTEELANKADVGHTHVIRDITGLPDKINTFEENDRTHSSDIASNRVKINSNDSEIRKLKNNIDLVEDETDDMKSSIRELNRKYDQIIAMLNTENKRYEAIINKLSDQIG